VALLNISATRIETMREEGSFGNVMRAEEIRLALHMVVASSAFFHSPKFAVMLRFVVEAALAGDGSQLKGYMSAVDARGRGPNVDSRVNAIVRADADRIRCARGAKGV
jgi:hypothetical protein